MASTSSAAGAVRLEQEHRLVAEALVGVGDERRRPWRRAGVGAIAGDARRRLPDEVEQRALEQPVQALPARVDDAGLAQDRAAGCGVRATDFSAASTVAARTASMSLSRSAATTAASADSRMTVRIVPSTGLATAP